MKLRSIQKFTVISSPKKKNTIKGKMQSNKVNRKTNLTETGRKYTIILTAIKNEPTSVQRAKRNSKANERT